MVISDGAQNGRALLRLSVFEEQVKRVDMQALRYGKTCGGARKPGSRGHPAMRLKEAGSGNNIFQCFISSS